MSIASEISRIQGLVGELRTNIINKGVQLASDADLETCVDAVPNISGGGGGSAPEAPVITKSGNYINISAPTSGSIISYNYAGTPTWDQYSSPIQMTNEAIKLYAYSYKDNLYSAPVYASYGVSYIYSSSTTVQYTTCYFNTGILTPLNNENAVLEIYAKFRVIVDDGNFYIGNMGNVMGSSTDTADLRIFRYQNRMQFDCGSTRLNTLTGASVGEIHEYTFTVDYQNQKYNVVDLGNTVVNNYTFSNYPRENTPIYIAIPKIYFYNMTIKKNGVLVFNGEPALNGNNEVSLYDSVSGSYILPEGIYKPYAQIATFD